MTTRSEGLDSFGPRIIDGQGEELTRRLLAWCRQRCTCAKAFEKHVTESHNASVFVQDCAQRDTTFEEAVIIAKEVLLFWLMHNCSPQELKDYILYLKGGPAWSSEIAGFYGSFIEEMRQRGMKTAPYHAATIDLCEAKLAERSIDRSRMSSEEYFAMRRLTIAGTPYVVCWMALRHRDLADPAAKIWSELRIVDLMNEVMGLTNDLGSMERDMSPHGGTNLDLSYIFIRHEGNPTLESRIEATIDLVNRLIEKTQNRLLLLEEAAISLGEPRLLDYVDFTTDIINGNRQSTIRLSNRYPGSLERLRRVRELSRNR